MSILDNKLPDFLELDASEFLGLSVVCSLC